MIKNKKSSKCWGINPLTPAIGAAPDYWRRMTPALETEPTRQCRVWRSALHKVCPAAPEQERGA